MTGPLIVVAGPTGTGKSDLAIRLAEAIGGEIVNYDSVQVYRGFDIGSAKPAAEERRRVSHHLFDIVDRHAEMIESADIAVAHRIDVESDVAVADIGTADRARLALGGSLKAEHRLVESRHHRPVRTANCDVIDLGEHVLSPCGEPEGHYRPGLRALQSHGNGNVMKLPGFPGFTRCTGARLPPHWHEVGVL